MIKIYLKTGRVVNRYTAHPIVWNGVNYKSITAAARDLGLTVQGMSDRINRGWTCDEDARRKSAEYVWNGTIYTTIDIAADALGVARTTLIYRRQRGYVCDEDMKDFRW